MTVDLVDERRAAHTRELEQDLPVLAQQFGLGRVADCAYLPHGLMNPNWRLTTDRGVFAVKRIVDVPLEWARRNHGHCGFGIPQRRALRDLVLAG